MTEAPQTELAALSAWPERRPPRTESERHEIAEHFARHLPPSPGITIPDEDIYAMRAAFIKRFDEQLPRTETLFAVAMIGYRMALRDFASRPSLLVDTGEALREALAEARQFIANCWPDPVAAAEECALLAKIDAALAAHPQPEEG